MPEKPEFAFDACVIFSLAGSTSGATYLVTMVSVGMDGWMYGCLLAALLAHTHNFKNFIRSQKFQNENMFQTILSNFDFQIFHIWTLSSNCF